MRVLVQKKWEKNNNISKQLETEIFKHVDVTQTLDKAQEFDRLVMSVV